MKNQLKKIKKRSKQIRNLLYWVIILLFIIAINTCNNLCAQTIDTTRVNPVCAERGHIQPNVVSKTLLYCPPYYEDSEDSTVLVYPACNWITYRCMRCGQIIEEKEEEVRVTVWRRHRVFRPVPMPDIIMDTVNVLNDIIWWDTSPYQIYDPPIDRNNCDTLIIDGDFILIPKNWDCIEVDTVHMDGDIWKRFKYNLNELE